VQKLGWIIPVLALVGCPRLKPGNEISKSGATGTHIDASTPRGTDGGETSDLGASLDASGPGDATSFDALSQDAWEADANVADTLAADAIPADAQPHDASCSTMSGRPCTQSGLCGATYDCSGVCQGGTAAPSCPCGPASCQGNTWICTGTCCTPNTGMSCVRAGYCGSVYDCTGTCTGGTPQPGCNCSTPQCLANGTWSACSDPSTFGQRCDDSVHCAGAISCNGTCQGGNIAPACSCAAPVCHQGGALDGRWTCADPANLGSVCQTANICGGRIDCAGACSGGNALPTCHCNALACQADGTWSACSDPANYGASCNSMTACGGTIDCSGGCSGGNPYPTCQCGMSTCGGCVGGTCGANSQCTSGTCQCITNNCACPSGSNTSCTYCNGAVLTSCGVDAFNCGAISSAIDCPFGCDAMTLMCACSPNQGMACSAGTCDCGAVCGILDLPGTIDCSGNCAASDTCANICLQHGC
jgi:hypothetical protein